MNPDSIEQIASAVMYEGYLLYPYRPAIKNTQRFTFGTLFPQEYCQRRSSGDAYLTQTQCLLLTAENTALEVRVRFLQPVDRLLGTLSRPLLAWPEMGEPAYEPVPTLQVGNHTLHAWQETVEQAVIIPVPQLADLLAKPSRRLIRLPAARTLEPVWDGGKITGLIIRQRHAVSGRIELSIGRLENQLYRLTIVTINDTPLVRPANMSRDDALVRSLLATHTVIRVTNGDFISQTDPPQQYREAAAACKNIGVWPVLVGEQGSTNAVLSAPIILYDYPQIAPESPGDLCDGTEIDEILSLRIMTLTEEEQRAAAAADSFARQILDRTERLARGQLLNLHGTFRDPSAALQERSHAVMEP